MKIVNVMQGVRSLESGGVIAYPTEGVWGLGCAPGNSAAVQKILSLKERPVAKGLILVTGSMRHVDALLSRLTPDEQVFLKSVWPGPDTWLLPDSDQLIPTWIKGKFDTVAVRVSTHPVIVDLCEGFGGLIVSTSANPAGLTPAKTVEKVHKYFPEGIDIGVHGCLGDQAGPSSIKDLKKRCTLRE